MLRAKPGEGFNKRLEALQLDDAAHRKEIRPGHASLLVWGEQRNFLLAGDLVERAADLPAARPDIAAFAAEHGLVVLTAHDPEAARA